MATRRFLSRLSSLFAVMTLVTGAFITTSVAASAAPAPASLSIAPTVSSVSPTGSFAIMAHITNTSGKKMASARVDFAANQTTITTAQTLASWLDSSTGGSLPGSQLESAEVPTLASGASADVSIRVSGGLLGSPSNWGVRGLSARLQTNGTTLATARSSMIVTAGTAPVQLNLAAIIPIVAAPSALGLMSHDELATATGPTGYLTGLLSAAQSSRATVAVDPKITTSIVAAGSQAPASAITWLKALNALTNDGFWLSYGDSDLMGQLQAGAASPLVPQTTDLANIPQPSPTASASPATGSAVPSWAGWTPTLDGLAWPVANTVGSAKNLNKLNSVGYNRLLISSGNLESTSVAHPHVSVAGWNSAAIDEAVSNCLAAAQRATSQFAAAANTSCALSYLATAVTSGSNPSTTVATLSRILPSEWASVSATGLVSQLFAQPWIQPASVSQVFASPANDAALVPRLEGNSRITAIRNVLANQNKLVAFSPVSSDPAVVVNPGARRAAAVLSAGWPDATSWQTARITNAALTTEVLNSVSIVSSSTINMVGGQARIPVLIRNDLDAPVTVILRAEPSNARLVVDGTVKLTIQANSQSRAYVPVSARVGSGSVDLVITLTSTTGAQVGSPQTIPVRVRADWEAFGLVGIGVIFVGLVIAGVIRTVRKRKGQPRG